jgi:hypothetical protein
VFLLQLTVTAVTSTNKTDRHNIAEILLKVALNIKTITPQHYGTNYTVVIELTNSIGEVASFQLVFSDLEG